ncbi:hypothetical protein [Blastococcus deserti]|uniref:Excreted virulence factor EspC (Type VII ESX diderm) n=1 Tax=Blastococcus deserti TaxID=2259033 RepID=A0ABW4X8A8_9ACTN
MSSPVPAGPIPAPPTPPGPVVVRPEAVTGLAGELTLLAAELSDDAHRCRAAAGSLTVALDGEEGWSAGAAAIAWARLEEVLAERTAALAETLAAAAGAYVAEDARLAAGIGPDSPAAPR